MNSERYYNDLAGPRIKKGGFRTNVICPELWNEFKTQFPEHANKKNTELRKLWDDISETIRDEAVTNPLGVKLGSYAGEIKVQYLPYKMNVDMMNEAESSKYGRNIPHLNITQRGKHPLVKWERRWAVRFNRMLQFYGFDGCRKMCRMANKHIEAHPESLRTARNTLGGFSIWRQIKKLG